MMRENYLFKLVPTVSVGMQFLTLCVFFAHRLTGRRAWERVRSPRNIAAHIGSVVKT